VLAGALTQVAFMITAGELEDESELVLPKQLLKRCGAA
jgi:hypothetical protein